MSLLTEAIVLHADDELMEKLNDTISRMDNARRQEFRRIDMDNAGGTKWYVEQLWAACFNYFQASQIKAAADEAWCREEYNPACILAQNEEGDWTMIFAPHQMTDDGRK